MPTTFETLPPGPGIVKVDGLNLRDAPEGTIRRELTIGDRVQVIEAATNPRWRRVRVGNEEGYVAARYIRPPENDEIEALVARAIREWVRFKKGAASEKTDPYAGYVKEMWDALDPKLGYDGRSVDAGGKDVPWSAAFISFVVREAGTKYREFRFAAGHSVFVRDAIQARIFERMNRPFWGYRIDERRPAIGDIVARNRAGNTFSYDFAETNSQYQSHSDIVVDVSQRSIRVLGGNIGNTVTLKHMASGDDVQEYLLDSQGFILPGQKVIAVLKNRAQDCP